MAEELSRAAAAGGDLVQALEFVRGALTRQRDRGMVPAEECDALDAHYQDLQRLAGAGEPPGESVMLPARDRCWDCKELVGAADWCRRLRGARQRQGGGPAPLPGLSLS